jgi:choloylglycine hydrolase
MVKMKMLLSGCICVLILLGSFGLNFKSFACTGLTVKTQDGYIIFTRSLEYAYFLDSHLTLIPRGYQFTGSAPNGNPGMKWTTKYRVMGLNMYGMDMVTDGINEKGLYSGIFLFPGFAGYQKVSPEEYSKTLGSWELTTWLLTSFGSVKEVKQGLSRIKIGNAVFKPQKIVFPVHIMISDASGNSAVIEYVKGELHFHDNPLGVITNSPTFDWHLTNLRNYINLTATDPAAKEFFGYKLAPLGEGMGMKGLPGDYSPPSRFIKAVLLGHSAKKVKGADAGVRQAWQILNTFFITKGNVRNITPDTPGDHTQWQAVSDLKNLRYFVATYKFPRLRMYSLEKAHFQTGKIIKISIDDNAKFYKDVFEDLSEK